MPPAAHSHAHDVADSPSLATAAEVTFVALAAFSRVSDQPRRNGETAKEHKTGDLRPTRETDPSQ